MTNAAKKYSDTTTMTKGIQVLAFKANNTHVGGIARQKTSLMNDHKKHFNQKYVLPNSSLSSIILSDIECCPTRPNAIMSQNVKAIQAFLR